LLEIYQKDDSNSPPERKVEQMSKERVRWFWTLYSVSWDKNLSTSRRALSNVQTISTWNKT